LCLREDLDKARSPQCASGRGEKSKVHQSGLSVFNSPREATLAIFENPALGGYGHTVRIKIVDTVEFKRDAGDSYLSLVSRQDSFPQQRTRQTRRPATAVDAEFGAREGAEVEPGVAEAGVGDVIFFEGKQASVA
jgi:hypothetical protein